MDTTKIAFIVKTCDGKMFSQNINIDTTELF